MVAFIDLPRNLLSEILTRLPLRTLFVTKCVSKTFLDLISPHNPDFTTIHTAIASPILIFQLPKFMCRVFLFDFELDVDHGWPNGWPKELWESIERCCNDGNPFELTNSCNSLLYFVRENGLDVDSLVCNPVTNEYLMIPAVDMGDEIVPKIWTVCSWLGFCPRTNQYKVLKIQKVLKIYSDDSDETSTLMAKVYDIGSSNSWKDIMCHNPKLLPDYVQRSHFYCEFLNGFMYWMCSSTMKAISFFDFEKEMFGEIKLPYFFQDTENEPHVLSFRMSIGVASGFLWLSYNVDGLRVILWRLEYGQNEYNWKEVVAFDFSHLGSGLCYSCKPIQYLRNDEILLLGGNDEIVCYNIRNKSLTFLKESIDFYYYRVAALVPNFVSLKDILKVDHVIVNTTRPTGEGDILFEIPDFEDNL